MRLYRIGTWYRPIHKFGYLNQCQEGKNGIGTSLFLVQFYFIVFITKPGHLLVFECVSRTDPMKETPELQCNCNPGIKP